MMTQQSLSLKAEDSWKKFDADEFLYYQLFTRVTGHAPRDFIRAKQRTFFVFINPESVRDARKKWETHVHENPTLKRYSFHIMRHADRLVDAIKSLFYRVSIIELSEERKEDVTVVKIIVPEHQKMHAIGKRGWFINAVNEYLSKRFGKTRVFLA